MLEFAQIPEELRDRYTRAGYYRGEVLGDLLRSVARSDGARVALTDARGRWSYRELDAWADRLASGFYELGLRAEDRVVVQLPNVASFAAVTIALFRLGAVPVFALPNHRRLEVKYLCECSEARAYVTIDSHLGFDYLKLAREVRSAVPALTHVLVDGDAREFVALRSIEQGARELAPPSSRDVALFLLSGGTTGLPKLIPRTHDDYAYQLRATAQGLGFDERGVYLAVLPVAHNAALGCPGLLGALRAGGKVVFPPAPSPEQTIPLVVTEGVTLTTLMPPLVGLWLEAAEREPCDLSQMILQVGSQRFAPELSRRARSELKCKITQWFGMAEGLLTFTRLSDPETIVDNTQGRPLCPDDELRVVDERDRPLGAGRVGELLTRGPYTIRGYYRADDHNSRAFSADGFLRTGDLVQITSEGNLVVEGRLKDVINRGGEKVSAAELEDLLLEHPAVRQVAAVAMPDEAMGERVALFVVARAEAPELRELRRFLRERGLADYKLPDRLELLPTLPQTQVGKVNKAALRELLRAQGGSAA